MANLSKESFYNSLPKRTFVETFLHSLPISDDETQQELEGGMLQQDQYTIQKLHGFGAVVVAHLVERLLPTPMICGSIPVISKFYLLSTVLGTVMKRRNYRKRPDMVHFLKS